MASISQPSRIHARRLSTVSAQRSDSDGFMAVGESNQLK